MDFSIHDESNFDAEEAFLEGWLPVASAALLQSLGMLAVATPIHVVLSGAQTHRRRFPPRTDEVRQLIQRVDPIEDDDLAALYPVTMYAHGVTTIAAQQHSLPADVTAGDAAVFIDVETVNELAERYGVSREAMLGRVVLHELAHVLRNHVHPGAHTTHGYLAEVDAQRDTWEVLEAMLTDSQFGDLALAARAAQVRLSANQPDAYQQYGASSPDRYAATARTMPSSCTYVVRTARDLAPLFASPVIEMPIFHRQHEEPKVGDRIFLNTRDATVGPWIVLNTPDEAIDPSRHDDWELGRLGRVSMPADQRSQMWLRLRPASEMWAGKTDCLDSNPCPFALTRIDPPRTGPRGDLNMAAAETARASAERRLS